MTNANETSHRQAGGACLCGEVAWTFEGPPKSAYHCHCSMCRKMHGTAFGTYYLVPVDRFAWTGNTDSIKVYTSSPTITRTFCSSCGAVVPDIDEADGVRFVPAGCHGHGFSVDAHIFVASKAPWYTITDNLPQYPEYSPEENLPSYPDKELPTAPAGVIRGSCLCDAVAFHLHKPPKAVFNCHCSRCRQARSAAHATNGFCDLESFDWIRGEAHVNMYKLPTARYFAQSFCDICGSSVPRTDADRGIAVVPFGVLDDDPGVRASDHIFTADKADWFEITDSLPTHVQGVS